jgi:hypothetical protein
MKKTLPNDTSGALDKKIVLALVFAAFGILLFIALALTLPQGFSSSR